MKQVGIVLLALALLVGCGSGSSSPTSPTSPTIDGNWSAVLLSFDATTTVYAFTTSLKQNSGSTVTVTNFSFSGAPPCVASPETVTAELDGGFKNNSGFAMSISAGPPEHLGIELIGNVQNNTLTGDWSSRSLISCHASGSFTMTRM